MAQYKARNGKSWRYDFKTPEGKHIERNGFKTKKEAKDAERIHKLRLKMQSKDDFETILVSKFAQLKTRNQESSLKRFSKLWRNHIKPFFPNKLLSEYTVRDIDKLVITLSENGRTNKTINDVIEFISNVFNFGIKRQMCYSNPCSTYDRLPLVKEEITWWTEEQFNKVMEYEDNFEYFVFYHTLFWTGARKGEIQALQWPEVDLKNGKLKINKHFSNTLMKVISGRKNGKGYTIKIDSELTYLLKQLYEKNSQIDGFTKDSFVFGTIRPLPAETIRRRLHNASQKAGVVSMKVHGLRHSHVSYLFNNTTLTIQEIAGRIGDTTEVVLRTYAHHIKENDEKVINAIEKAKIKNRT